MDESELKKFAAKQFELQSPMLSLWQTIAENFYPERADFTSPLNVGIELADHLMSSYPLLVRRDLGNSLSAMLRDGRWFEMSVRGEADHLGQGWLEWGTDRLFDLFDDRRSNSVRAMGQADHDYVTFGSPVLSCVKNKRADGLLFQHWHLRDCAWWDGDDAQVAGLVRREAPFQRNLVTYFGEDKVHKKVREDVHKNPFKEINIRHFSMPSDMYGDEEIQSRFPHVSIYLDIDNNHLIEAVGQNTMQYCVPRFQTIAGHPYAYSPATIIALPDARLVQGMTHTLLEAGERYARPPLIATEKAIRGDVNLGADGITYADKEYDEKMGAALRPLYQNQGGFPIGMELRNEVFEILKSAFYLDTINLPDPEREMTAFEFDKRMKEFRRRNLPLFAPLEHEYSAQICELAFDTAMHAGFLGSPQDIPASLRGSDVEFKFKSPLSAAEEEKRVHQWGLVAQQLEQAAAIDPNMSVEVDIRRAFRDSIKGSGVPTNWLNPPEVAQQMREQHAQAQMAQAAIAAQAQGGKQ